MSSYFRTLITILSLGHYNYLLDYSSSISTVAVVPYLYMYAFNLLFVIITFTLIRFYALKFQMRVFQKIYKR